MNFFPTPRKSSGPTQNIHILSCEPSFFSRLRHPHTSIEFTWLVMDCRAPVGQISYVLWRIFHTAPASSVVRDPSVYQVIIVFRISYWTEYRLDGMSILFRFKYLSASLILPGDFENCPPCMHLHLIVTLTWRSHNTKPFAATKLSGREQLLVWAIYDEKLSFLTF